MYLNKSCYHKGVTVTSNASVKVVDFPFRFKPFGYCFSHMQVNNSSKYRSAFFWSDLSLYCAVTSTAGKRQDEIEFSYCSMPNSDPIFWMSLQKRWLVIPSTIFQILSRSYFAEPVRTVAPAVAHQLRGNTCRMITFGLLHCFPLTIGINRTFDVGNLKLHG